MSNEIQNWDGYNNIGICATAIGCILEEHGELTFPKILLVMPLVMHEATLRFLAKGNVRARQIAAFTSLDPEFIVNFNERFQQSLVVTLNALQLLICIGYLQYDGIFKLIKIFEIDEKFGKRAELIRRAAPNISILLMSGDDELYLNLRVKL